MNHKFIVIVLFALFLSGCYSNDSLYSGIEAKDILDSEDSNLDLLYEYKGSTENWAASYIIYSRKGHDNHTSRLLFKYVGKKPEPTGNLSYSYDTDAGGGHGEFPVSGIKDRIYTAGSSGGNGAIPMKNTVITIQITWNGHSEKLELKTKN